MSINQYNVYCGMWYLFTNMMRIDQYRMNWQILCTSTNIVRIDQYCGLSTKIVSIAYPHSPVVPAEGLLRWRLWGFRAPRATHHPKGVLQPVDPRSRVTQTPLIRCWGYPTPTNGRTFAWFEVRLRGQFRLPLPDVWVEAWMLAYLITAGVSCITII